MEFISKVMDLSHSKFPIHEFILRMAKFDIRVANTLGNWECLNQIVKFTTGLPIIFCSQKEFLHH